MKTNQIYTDRGFTLIELLVSVTIIGILAGVAIPQYARYKQKAFDSIALSDLRNIALAEEAYFVDFEEYLSCTEEGCLELPGIVGISKGVSVSVTAQDQQFTGSATHRKGTGRVYSWDSAHGGLL